MTSGPPNVDFALSRPLVDAGDVNALQASSNVLFKRLLLTVVPEYPAVTAPILSQVEEKHPIPVPNDSPLQGYLAHKQQPPLPRTTIWP